jgi:hypothetical protein
MAFVQNFPEGNVTPWHPLTYIHCKTPVPKMADSNSNLWEFLFHTNLISVCVVIWSETNKLYHLKGEQMSRRLLSKYPMMSAVGEGNACSMLSSVQTLNVCWGFKEQDCLHNCSGEVSELVLEHIPRPPAVVSWEYLSSRENIDSCPVFAGVKKSSNVRWLDPSDYIFRKWNCLQSWRKTGGKGCQVGDWQGVLLRPKVM